MQFHGSIVALVTPFNRKGQVDRKALERLVEWHIQEGTDGIVSSGTTGEGIALSERERRFVAEVCVGTAGGRLPIIVGPGMPGTRESVRLAEMAQRAGAQGCLIVTPYYNKPSQRGCVLHYGEVAKVGLPVIAYHNPGRAVVRLSAETVAEIGAIPGVVAMKDSSGDVSFVRKVRSLSSLPILAGEDDLTFDILREGGVGAISVIGNLFPRVWKRMIALALQGQWEEARAIAERLLPACKANFLESNPQPLKFAMEWFGLCRGEMRLPMVRVTEEVQREMKRRFVALFLPQFSRITLPQKG